MIRFEHKTYCNVRQDFHPSIPQQSPSNPPRDPALEQTEDLFPPHYRNNRPLTMWPQFEDGVVMTVGYTEIPKNLLQGQFIEKTEEKEDREQRSRGKDYQRASGCGSDLQLHLETAQVCDAENQHPELKRKTRVKGSNQNTASGQPKTPPSLSKIKKLRERISSGKLERVIPPWWMLDSQKASSSPRSRTPPHVAPVLELSPNSKRRHQRLKSPLSSKFTENFQVGVDVFDEKRREMVGKIRCPTFGSHPSQLVRSPSKSFRRGTGGYFSSGMGYEESVTSFFCVDAREVEWGGVGEEEIEKDMKAEIDTDGVGIDHREVNGSYPRRGVDMESTGTLSDLFLDCEREYRVLNEMSSFDEGFPAQDKGLEEEIKPTPPLKINKGYLLVGSNLLSPLKDKCGLSAGSADSLKVGFVNNENGEKDIRKPTPPPKDDIITMLWPRCTGIRGNVEQDYGTHTFYDDDDGKTFSD